MNRERINANPAPWAWPDLRGWNLYFLSKLALAWMGALNLHVLPNLLLLAALLLPLPWRWARIARTTRDDGAAVPGARPADQWLQSARFGVQWLLPQAQVHWSRVMQPALDLPFLAT